MVSRLSTWTSTPTGIGGPEIKWVCVTISYSKKCRNIIFYTCCKCLFNYFIINVKVDRAVKMIITEAGSTFYFWNLVSKNSERLLVPQLRQAGWDSIFDLFQPFYSAASSSNHTQIQLGHKNGSKLMEWWMKSSSLFHFHTQLTVKIGHSEKNTAGSLAVFVSSRLLSD